MKNLILILISVFVMNTFMFQKNTFANDVRLYTKIIYPTDKERQNNEMESTCNSYTDHLLIHTLYPEYTMTFEQNDPIVSAVVQCDTDVQWHMQPIVHYDATAGDYEFHRNADGTPIQYYSVKTKCAFIDEADNLIQDYRVPAHVILVCIDHNSINLPEKNNK